MEVDDNALGAPGHQTVDDLRIEDALVEHRHHVEDRRKIGVVAPAVGVEEVKPLRFEFVGFFWMPGPAHSP